MKHLKIYQNNIGPDANYEKHLNEAIVALNTSATYKRNEADPSHEAERKAIIHAMMESFTEKTEEDIIEDLINAPQITPAAVDDYIYFHYRNFPGYKASVIPYPFDLAIQKGLHVAYMIEGSLTLGSTAKTNENELKPITILCYFNDRKDNWVSFRIEDAEMFSSTKSFKDRCINNGLELISGSGKEDEFAPLVKFIRAYRAANKEYIPVKSQYTHIGWNKEKTEFLSPRNKDIDFLVNNEEYQNDVDCGYISRGDNPAKNVNDMLAILKDFPLACAVYATPFTNPIIGGVILDVNFLTIDLYGPQGKGKNLLQYAALNPMGDSREQPRSPLMKSWTDASISGTSSMIAFHANHTVCIEESQLIEDDVLSKIAYKVFNAGGGDKAEQNGATRKNQRFSSHVISSGESSMLSRVKRGGLTRRILPIGVNDIFGPLVDDPAALKGLHNKLGAVLSESFGIALDPFVTYMVERRKETRKAFKAYQATYTALPDNVMFDHQKHKTFAQFTACVHLVLDHLHDLYNLTAVTKEEIAHICQQIHTYCMELCTKQNKDLEALSEVYTHAVTNEDKYFQEKKGYGNSNHAQQGVFRSLEFNGVVHSCLFFETNELKRFLGQVGYNAENAMNTWKQLGVLYGRKENKGRGRESTVYSIQTRIRNNGTKVYCSVFLLDKVQEILGALNGGSAVLEFSPKNAVQFPTRK